ncbi:MAG: ABC transporter permease [Methanomassiliicoccus sp.]|nr:ABC transporter permease [Methanomassiliicoccus sp.]
MTSWQDVPSDFQQIGVTTRYEMEKHFQSRGFLGIMGLIGVVITLMTVIRPLLGLDFSSDAVSFVNDYTTWVQIIVLIGAVAFASGALSSEFEKRTGLLMFPQPVKRTTFLVGKYLSSTIVMALALGVYYLAVSILSLAIVGSVPETIVLSYGFAVLYGMAVCAVAMLFSSILKTNTAAIVATVLTFLMVMTLVTQLLAMSHIDPFFMTSNAGDVISYSLQSTYPTTYTTTTHTPNGGNIASTTYIPTEATAALVLLGYVVVSLLVANVLFKRRQF